MRVILLGSPGSGKGTQAQFITEKYAIPQISTGDMLRAAVREDIEFGRAAKKTMHEGGLVSDEIISGLIKDRIVQSDCSNGFLLDGFPRTIAQAESLLAMGVGIDHVIEIAVADDEIIKRMGGRLVHLESGRTYHIEFNPPKVANKDDVTGEPLIQRDDDQEATVKKRLDVYHQQTKPLVGYYEAMSKQGRVQFTTVTGVGAVADITAKVYKALA